MAAHNRKDLTGMRFGRLEVLSYVGTNFNRNAIYRVKCDCGSVFDALGTNLQSGKTKSCGCLRAQLLKEQPRHIKKVI